MSEPNHTPDAHTSQELEIKPPAHTGRPRKYPPEQIRRGLLVLAKHGGNAVQASAELAENGTPVPESTLYDWKSNQHPELYAEIHDTYSREIEARLIPELRDSARLAAQVARNAILRSQEQLDAGQVKDPGTLARNMATTGAINIDKLLLLTERPTVRTENTDVTSLLRSLEAVIPGLEPITDAQVIDEQPEPQEPAKEAPQSVSGRE